VGARAMDWFGQRALESQLDGLGRDFGLSSSPRGSKWSVFGRGSVANGSAAARSDASSAAADDFGAGDHNEERNFPPLLKWFYVDLAELREERAVTIMVNARLVLWMCCGGWALNLLTCFVLMVSGTHLGWLWFLLALLFACALFPVACWSYAMAFRGVRFGSRNVMRNSTWFYAGSLLYTLTYAIVGAANFNGWTRYLTSYGDLRVFWDVMASLEASLWSTISVALILVIIWYHQLAKELAESTEASEVSLQSIRDRYGQVRAGT